MARTVTRPHLVLAIGPYTLTHLPHTAREHTRTSTHARARTPTYTQARSHTLARTHALAQTHARTPTYAHARTPAGTTPTHTRCTHGNWNSTHGNLTSPNLHAR